MFKFILPKFIFKIERWKWNKEYRIYVSNMGHFMDEHKKIIPVKIDARGYVAIKTPYGIIKAHRLVMFTWRPTANMENLTVDHLNHNKRDNSVYNLEWVTDEENKTRAREDYLPDIEKREKRKQSGSVKKKKNKNMKTERKIYSFDDFYPMINGIAFDDTLTAWWYCQEILAKRRWQKNCTLEGLQKKFQTLLNLWNNNHVDYISGKSKLNICKLEIGFELKEREEN